MITFVIAAVSMTSPRLGDGVATFLHRHQAAAAAPLRAVMRLKPVRDRESNLALARRTARSKGVFNSQGRSYVHVPIASIVQMSEAFDDCRLRHDAFGLHAILDGIPSRFAGQSLTETDLEDLVSTVMEMGLYVSNVDNSPQEAMSYIANYPGEPGFMTGHSSYLDIVAIQLGDRDPDLLDALSTEAKTSFFLPEIIPTYFPEGEMPSVADQPLFYAEILAAEDNSDQWLEEVHARRALAVYPNQAMSAMLLMPLLGATHRTEEAMQIGQMALRNSVGDGRSDIQGRINGILTIRSRGG